MNQPKPAARRIISLDQFRGYTVAGMMLVNFIGSYAAVHAVFKHNKTWCSYADTIMPQFFFAVGFAFRLTFLSRLKRDGRASALRRMLGRAVGLILVGVVLYRLDGGVGSWADLQARAGWPLIFQALHSSIFQTLVHIGVTTLWVLPVIAAPPAIRILFAIASGLLHLWLTHYFYYDWAWANGAIDGGPLGFLTWTIPVVAGSLAYDAVTNRGARRALRPLLTWGILLLAVGYALSCITALRQGAWLAAAPFTPPLQARDLWTMSQKTASLSYLTFATGLALGLYALFLALCDWGSLRSSLLETLGKNALAVYIIHSLVSEVVQPYVPRDAPLWYVLAGFGIFFFITWLFVWRLEKNEIFLRL